MITRRLNCKPSEKIPNARQYHHLALGDAQLPSKADLRPMNPPIFNQGDQGSCTAHAGARLQGILQNMVLRKQISVPGILFDDNQYTPVSRDMIYYCERDMDGDIVEDGGSSLTTFTKVAEQIGFCKETLWPYSDQVMYTKPSPEAYAEAAQHKILKAYQLGDLYHMKHALVMGYPFVFGIQCYESFLSEATAASGVVPMPKLNAEQCQGGHALCMVGYDDGKGAFLFANSWGEQWGQQGYAWLPYEYVQDAQLFFDAWTLIAQP